MTRLGDALYRLLLRLFPARTRATHGDDMVRVFALQRAALAGRRAALAALWIHAIADVLRHGLAARWQETWPGARTPARWLAECLQDVHYALRVLRRAPGFTLVAVATLALGVGGNSAIFSVVQGVLREPLPFPDADRLHRVRMRYPDGSAYTTLSAPDFMTVRSRTRVFERVEAYTSGVATLLGAGQAQEVRAVSVSDGLLSLLDLRLALGRPFVAGEHQPGRNGVAILDYGYWLRVFGGDRGVVGRTVTIGGISYAIVGVLDRGVRLPPDVPGARLPSEADVYLPMAYDEAFDAATTTRRNSRFLGVFGLARSGVTPAAIDADLDRLAASLSKEFPESNDGLSMNALDIREMVVGDVRRPLITLFAATAIVLLIACVNIATLMLARGASRRRELAVRAALGGGRGRLIRQLLTESCVLGAIGGAGGLAIAFWAVRALVLAQPADLPRLDSISIDTSVVLFTFGVALLCSVIFGTAPALQATGRRLIERLRSQGRGGGDDRRAQGARSLLVAAEIALAVVLLTTAGLFLRSLEATLRVDPSFVADQALSFRVTIYGRGYTLARVRALGLEFEAGLRALPQVRDAAVTSVLPLSGPGPRQAFSVDGAPPPPANVNPEIGVVSVSAGYFQTIGAPVVRGRGFSERDDEDAPPVAIVNQAAVTRWFPDGQPIGQRVEMNGRREVVGVVADILQGDPRQPVAPQLFVPYPQRPTRLANVVVRTAGDPLALAPAIRAAMHAIDPSLPVAQLAPLTGLRAASVARARFYTALLTLAACVALSLAVTGIAGVLSQIVVERSGEISLRMALGARSGDVLRMIVGRAFMLALAGVAVGLVVSLALGRVVQTQLYGVAATDAMTLSLVTLILVSSALAASAIPARRATRLDPAGALRQ